MKHLPLLALLCLGLMFTAGCYVGDGLPSSYSPNGVNCSQNSAPAIGRSEFNSFAVDETWFMSIHFDWLDPNPQSAEDPPNMHGGRFTFEVLGYTSEDVELTEEVLTDACNVPPPEDEEGVDLCDIANHGMSGCSSSSLATCNEGEITIISNSLDAPLYEDQVIQLEFRVRDACDAGSNEKSTSYVIGSGLKSEEAEEEGEGA